MTDYNVYYEDLLVVRGQDRLRNNHGIVAQAEPYSEVSLDRLTITHFMTLDFYEWVPKTRQWNSDGNGPMTKGVAVGSWFGSIDDAPGVLTECEEHLIAGKGLPESVTQKFFTTKKEAAVTRLRLLAGDNR